ncbi:MAG TPA: hypothetical protein VFX37_04880 [Pseudolabrys sp.]|nr:hypothetical protein [Pseudolabrys sp.]
MRIDDGVFVTTQKSIKDMERAQAAFHQKELRQRDGMAATAEYNAAAQAQRDKTAKLRALRLAKEEQDRAAAAGAPPPAAKAKAAGKKRR